MKQQITTHHKAAPIIWINFFYIFFSLAIVWPSLNYAFEFTYMGSEKTSRKVVEIELKDLLKEELNDEVIQEVQNRLWNLRIFSWIKVKAVNSNELLILVKDRWTFIPIFKLTSGGGSRFLAVGAYDINFQGKYYEIGGQYENLNDQPAGVVWYRNPQFNQNRLLRTGVDLWHINRIRIFYDINGEESQYYTLRRNKLNLFMEKTTPDNEFVKGIGLDSESDTVSSENLLSDQQKEINQDNNFEIEQNGETHSPYVYFTIGRLFYENYLIKGQILNFTFHLHPNQFSNRENQLKEGTFSSHSFNFKKYWLLGSKNIAWNFVYFNTTHPQIQYTSFQGGLSEVRGYQDGQFFNSSSWQNNLEYRFDVGESARFNYQAVLFSDQGKVEQDINELINSKDQVLLSAGVGLRIISPSIYRFIGRIDYAQTFSRYINHEISFGVQQFF